MPNPTRPLSKNILKRLTKKQKAVAELDREKLYTVDEAIAVLREHKAKFDETVEVAMNLGVDPRHADQMVRGMVSLPGGTGKDVKVAVFARGDNAEKATAAGADKVGVNTAAIARPDLIDEISERFGNQVLVLDNLSRKGAEKNLEWLKSIGPFYLLKTDVRDADAGPIAGQLHAEVSLQREVAVPGRGRRVRVGRSGDVRAVDLDVTFSHRDQADDHIEASGFARAVRAQQPDDVARFDVHRHAAHDFALAE